MLPNERGLQLLICWAATLGKVQRLALRSKDWKVPTTATEIHMFPMKEAL